MRNLPGFVLGRKSMGTMTPWENELGKCEDVRYVSSTIFAPFADAGWLKAAGASGTCLPPAAPTPTFTDPVPRSRRLRNRCPQGSYAITRL